MKIGIVKSRRAWLTQTAKLLFAILGLSMFQATFATDCKARLYGKWKSDRDRSMQFIDEHVKLAERQHRLFAQLFGHLVLEVKEDAYHLRMPDLNIRTQNGNHSLKGFDRVQAYTILGCDADSLVLRTKMDSDENKISLYHFDTPDSFWVYVDDVAGDINVREYFRRIQYGRPTKNATASPSCAKPTSTPATNPATPSPPKNSTGSSNEPNR